MTSVHEGGEHMAVDYATLKKGGWMRQKQKNKFALRVHVVGGHLTGKQLTAIQDVADRFGNGYVHLTARQAVEIPYMDVEDVEEIKAALAAGGVKPSVCGPRVRTTTACQGAATCPSGCIDTYDLAVKIDARYFARELPGKFKFGITGCRNNCLKTEENDLGIKGGEQVTWKEEGCIGCGVCVKACREDAIKMEDGKITVDYEKCSLCGRCEKACPTGTWDVNPGYTLSFGGLFGNHIHRGQELVPFVQSEEQLYRICDAVIQFYDDNAVANDRLQFCIERVGEERFKQVVQDAYYDRPYQGDFTHKPVAERG